MKEIDLINCEGTILKATKISGNNIRITDRNKLQIGIMSMKQLKDFISGKTVLFDSTSYKWLYPTVDKNMKPSEERLKEFLTDSKYKESGSKLLQCNINHTGLCKYSQCQTLEICKDCNYLIIKSKDIIIPTIRHTFDGTDFIEVAGEKVELAKNLIPFEKVVESLKEGAEKKTLEGWPSAGSCADADVERLKDLAKEKLEAIQNPEKAARFNEGKPQWSLVHFKSLEPMVKVLEFGAFKYAPRNWQKPMDKMKILESMQRHLAALFDGEEVDAESGISHMGHIMCNAMFYNYHKEKEKCIQLKD